MARSTLAERFEAKVQRSADHDLWTGSKKADGTGKLKVEGKTVTAPRVAWELVNGPVADGVEVVGCDVRACVRVEHLRLRGEAAERPPKRRAARGSGTVSLIRPGCYKLTVHTGRFDDGGVRRVHKTVEAASEAAARKLLPEFIAEVNAAPQPRSRMERDLTVDEGIARFLDHLAEDKGREDSTLRDYRSVHAKWFSPWIGEHRVRDVTDEDMDRLFGKMRRAGMSASRMQSARNLYGPFFRWARRARIITRSPMAEFELPTSKTVARARVPPDAEQLSQYLAAALEVVPDIVPLLTLAAVTGMRRGELVPIRRSKLDTRRQRVVVDTAIDGARLKPTKTRTNRHVAVDEESMDMLLRHCDRMDERALAFGVDIGRDAFVFSHEPDCSVPMSPGYVTHRVALLKEHLGIADKRPATIALEDEALRLFRQSPAPRPAGRPGPAPRGGMSFQDIGRELGRTGRWAKLAVDAALRREAAPPLDPEDVFDGSILALRKFTSSELLDAGFNLAAVADRQGHSPEVLVRHYNKARRSADQRAAAHLGRVVHGEKDGTE